MAYEAGKGDKRRPTDEQKYQENYDKIFRKSEPRAEAVVVIQQLERERLSSTQKVLDKQE